MKTKKSYLINSKEGNASATFEGSKKPSKKTIEALCKMVEIAFKELKKQPKTIL